MKKEIQGKIENHVKSILKLIGENPNREGLKETPKRVAKMYSEIFSGLDKATEPAVTVFKNIEQYDELICETNIEFHSSCEHHLVPFFGKIHIGYIPDKHYVGLSKLARISDYFSHKPQVQERLTTEIADYVMKKMKPLGCIVVIEAEHLCMSMRGVRKPRHSTVTSAILGNIDKNEFFKILQLAKRNK